MGAVGIRKWSLCIVCIAVAGCLLSCTSSIRKHFSSHDESITISPLATQLGFSAERPLVMGMNTSYAPLQFVNDKGDPSGFDVEFTRILMHRMGIPFTFSPNHWDKMSPGIIEGKYDMGMLVYSPRRKDLTNYSDAVFRMYYQIVYRKEDYSTFDFRHLKGKRIAYMKSRPIGLMLKEAEADDVSITDLGEAVTDLANGQYDGVICYRFQAKYNIELLGLTDVLKTDELALEPREYCYASHDSLLIAAINAELKRMEAEGITDEVYGEDVASPFDAIEIPMWIWFLLAALTIIFLAVFSIYSHRYSLRLEAAHQKLQTAYDQMAEKNEALLIANARAEESTRMKSHFIQQISHEIRTPLNILSGFTQILTAPDTKLSDAEKAEASTQIVESTDRITGLVNKMLELSDVSSKAVLERHDRVTPLVIAQQAVMKTGIAEVAHLLFELRQEEGADIPFLTNSHSAVRILELLLDNAVKFTRPAEAYLPRTTIEKKEKATLTVARQGNTVRFTIENTGTAIPQEEAEHIFEEFVQLDSYYDGMGIGLAVARSLARRLDGDVVLDTTFTDGARFVYELRL